MDLQSSLLYFEPGILLIIFTHWLVHLTLNTFEFIPLTEDLTYQGRAGSFLPPKECTVNNKNTRAIVLQTQKPLTSVKKDDLTKLCIKIFKKITLCYSVYKSQQMIIKNSLSCKKKIIIMIFSWKNLFSNFLPNLNFSCNLNWIFKINNQVNEIIISD